jgi:hypothetical protein
VRDLGKPQWVPPDRTRQAAASSLIIQRFAAKPAIAMWADK